MTSTAIAAIFLAACSSTVSSTKSSQRTTSSSNTSAVATLESAKAEVKQLEGVPAFSPPSKPFQLKGVVGKTIMVIPFIPIAECKTVSSTLQSIGSEKGLHVDIYSNDGTPAAWESGVQEAITEHDAAIVLVCADPAPISASLQQAINNHIPVVMTTFADNAVPIPPYLTAVTNVPLQNVSLGITDAILASQDGKPAHVLFLDSTSVTGNQYTAPEFISDFKTHCGNRCSLEVENVPASEWGEPQLTSLVSAQLQAHPNITDIFDLYSGMVTETLPAVTNHNIKLWTYAGEVEAPQDVANGKIAGDITFSNSWLSYAAMNQVFRLLSGLHPIDNPPPNTPVKLIDSSNVQTFLTSPNQGFGAAFKQGYESLWLKS